MPATLSSLAHLRDVFPSLVEEARLLYDRDRAFRDLCDAHAICVRAAKRSQASALGAEYAAQQERLEAELVRRLQGSTSAS